MMIAMPMMAVRTMQPLPSPQLLTTPHYGDTNDTLAAPSPKQMPEPSIVDVYAPLPNEYEQVGYILRIYDGFLAVFHQDNPHVPYYKTDVHADTLPVYDRMQLESGITVDDRVSLQKLLDDYMT